METLNNKMEREIKLKINEQKRKKYWQEVLNRARFEDKELILIDRGSLYYILGSIFEK